MTLLKTPAAAVTAAVASSCAEVACASARILRPHFEPIQHSIFHVPEVLTLVLGWVGPVVAEVRRSKLVVSDHAGQRIVTTLPDGTLFVWKKVRGPATASIEYLCRREWPATGDVSMSVEVFQSVSVKRISLRDIICDRGIVVFSMAPLNATATADCETRPAGVDSDLYDASNGPLNLAAWMHECTTPQVKTLSMLDWRALSPLPRNGTASVRTDWVSNIGRPKMLPFSQFHSSIAGMSGTEVMAISYDGSLILTRVSTTGALHALVLHRVDYTESHASLVRTRALPNIHGGLLMCGFVVGTTHVCGVYVNDKTNRRVLFIERAGLRDDYRHVDLGRDDDANSYQVQCVYPTFFVAQHAQAQIHKIVALPVHPPAPTGGVDLEGYTILPLEPMPSGGEWSQLRAGAPATRMRAYPHRFTLEAQREDDGAWFMQPFGVSTTDFSAGMGDAPMMQERLTSTSTRPVS